MFDELRGKSVLITGASTGIGAAVARGFGRCGARVGVHYNKSREEAEQVAAAVRTAGGEAAVLQGEVTQKSDVARIIDGQIQAFGRLDVLINNAGDVVRRSPFAELDDRLIDDIIALNARSVVTACRLAVPHLKKQGQGNIINIGSRASVAPAAKGASTIQLTSSLLSTAKQVSTSVVLVASAIRFWVNSLNFASVNNITYRRR